MQKNKEEELKSEELEGELEVEEELDDETEDMGQEPEEMVEPEPKPEPKVEKPLTKEELTSLLKSAKARLDDLTEEENKEKFLKELPARVDKIERIVISNQKVIQAHHAAILRLQDDFRISNTKGVTTQ